MRRCPSAVLLASLAVLVGCRPSPAPAPPPAKAPAQTEAAHGAMAAASGVARADAGKGPTDARMMPLTPMVGDVELLYGDPQVAGQPFVRRIHQLPGAKVPPHSHPVDEHITVVQGTWYFAIGPEFRQESLKELKVGSYAFAPKGSTTFGYSPDGAAKTFRFTKGVRVVAAGRRSGRIVQGYASGAIVQYEIEGPPGQRFMADEAAVTLP